MKVGKHFFHSLLRGDKNMGRYGSSVHTGPSNQPELEVDVPVYDDKTIERFWSKVDRRGPDDCWEWTGFCERYGRFKVDGKNMEAHRFALMVTNGEPTLDNIYALHRCDNPPCCNPAHLYWGSNGDNQRDAYSRNRRVAPGVRGSRNGKSKLTEYEVVEIKELIKTGFKAGFIAKKFGRAYTTISEIRRGANWKWV